MSHFAVIVAGDDLHKQLAAFDENDPATLPENGKWDGWLLGGRWTGFFQLRPGAAGVVGWPGLMTLPAPEGRADQCLWGDVDREAVSTPFATLRDGVWHDADEMDDAAWEAHVRAFLAALPDDILVSLVDCHV